MLPKRSMQQNQEFEGPKCHVQFILWLLNNVLDYMIDNRFDKNMVDVFTFGGSKKILPLLLEGFTLVSGRDSNFYGDFNKIKLIEHNCIKFYDLQNYFEAESAN